jgi:chromosome segregation ATPase
MSDGKIPDEETIAKLRRDNELFAKEFRKRINTLNKISDHLERANAAREADTKLINDLQEQLQIAHRDYEQLAVRYTNLRSRRRRPQLTLHVNQSSVSIPPL